MTTDVNSYTALVTGGSGYVGSQLIGRLLFKGCRVHVIIRPESDLSALADYRGAITVHSHDGSTQDMMHIVAASRPDVVYHLASLFLAQHQPEDVEQLIVSNVLFGTQLLEAMQAHGVTKLVNTGTSWQHFQNHAYDPTCLYAATKQAFEDLLTFYLATTGIRAISLILFDTYGPGDPRRKLFTLLRQVGREGTALAMSPGEQLIDLVYIDDVIDAFVLASERLITDKVATHERYAIAADTRIPLKKLVELYGRVIGKQIQVEWGGRPYRSREVMTPWEDGARIPGWVPRVGLEEGIRLMEMETPR